MACPFCETHVTEPSAVTFDEFLKEFEATWNSLESTEWRRGQTLMMTLWRTHPALHAQIQQGPNDPFYLDSRINDCLAFLKERM